MNTNNKKLIYGIALIVAALVAAAVFFNFKSDGPTLQEVMNEPAAYLNPDFKVSLRYPRH